MSERTLKSAREFLRAHFDKGARCPCCGQFVKLYKRKLNSGMARFLIALYRLTRERPNERWFHVSEIYEKRNLRGKSKKGGVNGDYACIKYWGLIDEKPSSDDQPTSGFWELTSEGYKFVTCGLRIKKHVKLYNNKFLGTEGNEVSIIDCLGEHFNYQELMNP